MLDELRDLFLAALKFDGEDAMPLVRDWNLAVKRAQESFDKLTDKDPNAVPVVRCRDCKCYYNTALGTWCFRFGRATNEQDYCSYGERKGGDE